MPQILLTKQLVVNLGKDEHGQQKTVTLPAGVQEVDAEIADHWFVKAHSQEITPSIAVNQELQDNFDQLKADHKALQTQSNDATKKINELEAQAKADAKTIADLQKQIADNAKAEAQAKADPKAK
ncbi:MAG: hypothetical protein RSC68_04450 [Acinetobacter sp.]